eukprot:CAMPEP_0175936096 /NCGR_PEP_ID=MMETSP0108-20121206/21429_1 /TAXON_ID=195067 ORGANISM="Goniomonas pacifica, Strain CCMP1869" /NCGR_SAMPLE_ID=MMETSP0108 /ASSEMBLY_ACC=CAM_ASM_000204 /LENGTH=147 /DNA_ID=CAMNT_0017260155 /DNA_START=9 /DNA_END=452 /DNA_ORIENTATION=-
MAEQKADDVLCELMAEVDHYQEIHHQMQVACKEGRFLLASTRRSTGMTRISPCQFDENMTASAKVNIDESGSLSFQAPPWVVSKAKQEGTETKKSDNPINWFGVLVPPALRRSQRHFLNATELCVDLANSARRIKELQTELESLTVG